MCFFPSDLLVEPEFRYENKLESLKRKDMDFMVEYLELQEEAARKAEAEREAKSTPAPGGAAAKGGKADPKKAAPKGGAKGAAPTEDKNSPQPITVEYPADTQEDLNFMIFERSFTEKVDITTSKAKKPPASAAELTGKTQGNAWGDLTDKLNDRTKVLLGKYKIIRPYEHSMAIKLRLNKEDPPEVVEAPVEEVPVAADVGKKKGK